MKYRKLRNYKYQLMETYQIQTAIYQPCDSDFVSLGSGGVLSIKRGYCWDGPSGPTIDTENFMRGSLVHDALYQLMRLRQLSLGYREYADDLMRSICIEDGMGKFRAWYTHKAVRWFGRRSASP